MSTHTPRIEERRDGTSGRIDHLLQERQQLLVLYCQAAGLEFHAVKPADLKRVITKFCQVLVDYVAAVHFELYNRIEEGKERRRAVLQVARKAHPRLTDITHHAVSFNDKYDSIGSQFDPGRTAAGSVQPGRAARGPL